MTDEMENPEMCILLQLETKPFQHNNHKSLVSDPLRFALDAVVNKGLATYKPAFNAMYEMWIITQKGLDFLYTKSVLLEKDSLRETLVSGHPLLIEGGHY